MKKIILLLILSYGLNAQTLIKFNQMENPATSSVNLGTQTFSAGNINGVGISRSHTIYYMGDSFTAANIYPAALTASAGTSFSQVNLGVSGETTTQMVARFYQISVAKGDYVVILGGANDLQGGLVAATTITNNLQAMATAAKNSGATVVMLQTTPFAANAGWSAGAQTIQNTVNAAITSTSGIQNVDKRVSLFTLLGGGTNSLSAIYNSGDGLHPNTLGYNFIASISYTTVGSFTATVLTPTVSFERSMLFNQSVATTNTPVFDGMLLDDSLKMANNPIFAGSITSTGSGSFAGALSAVGNSSFGLIYSSNSFQLNSGTGGSFGTGGTSTKILGGSTTYTNLTFGTTSFPNGRMQISNATGNLLFGDNASTVDDGVTLLQVQTTMSSPTISLPGSGPVLNLKGSGTVVGTLNFLNAAGTNTYLAITANSSTGELRYFARSGGYFPTWYTNGSEAMRLSTTANLLINTTTDVPSSKLTIASTTQGFLPPRMTATQGSAISSPAEGLIIYVTNTNGTFPAKGWWGYDGAAWQKLNN